MTVEELNEFQAQVDQGKPLDDAQCAALLAEVWRLKTVQTSKGIESRVARDEAERARAALDEALAENAKLRDDLERMTAINGLPVCELETRWSNCAVRQKKCANGRILPLIIEPSDHKASDV